MNDDPSADERAEIVRARAAARRRDYYARNKDAVAARQRDYRARNKDAVAAYQRDYRARNKDAVAAYQRDYYARNKDAIKLRRKLRKCGIDPREALA